MLVDYKIEKETRANYKVTVIQDLSDDDDDDDGVKMNNKEDEKKGREKFIVMHREYCYPFGEKKARKKGYQVLMGVCIGEKRRQENFCKGNRSYLGYFVFFLFFSYT